MILTFVNGVLAAALLACGWYAVKFGIFTNLLFLLFLVLFPLQVCVVGWRMTRKTLVNVFSKKTRANLPVEFWLKIANGCLFFALGIAVLHIRILPFQFTSEVYTQVCWIFWLTGLGLVVLQCFPTRRVFIPMNVALAIASGFMIQELVRIYWPISESSGIVIGSPVQGEWGVVQGGASSLINHHYNITEQRYALDLVRLANGMEFYSKEKQLESYASWGAPVYSPVSGTVVVAVDDLRDNLIGSTDSKNLAGNQVVIEIDPQRFVFLCHLKKGSLLVKGGDKVTEGQPIAQCGNSGNTSAPHLHIQAQNKADLFAPGARTYPLIIRGISVTNLGWPRSGAMLNLRANDVIVTTGNGPVN